MRRRFSKSLSIVEDVLPFSIRKHVYLIILSVFLIVTFFSFLPKGAATKFVKSPLFIRKGEMIYIPPDSALRRQIQIKTLTLSHQAHEIMLPATLELDPTQIVKVYSPLAGRVTSLNINLGDYVKKNQQLLVVNSPDLAQAYSDYDKAKSVLVMTSEAYKRAKAVHKAGGNSIKDIQSLKSAYEIALTELKRSEERVKILGKNRYSSLMINSPIAGRVAQLNISQGTYINDPLSGLMTITNLDPIWLTVSVPEILAAYVKKDQQVDMTIDAFPNDELHGKISYINPVVDSGSHTIQMSVSLPNHKDTLRPNMFGTAKIIVPQRHQIIIPISAVLMNDDTTVVYVEVQPWHFMRRVVKLGLEDGQQARVKHGLREGERVAVTGGIFIND